MSDVEIQQEVDDNDFGVVDVLNFDYETAKEVNRPSLPEDSINLFDKTQIDFYKNNLIVKTALAYIKSRRLDTATNRPDAFYISLKDYTHKNRLVIPFKDESGDIVFYQSRKIFDYDEKGSYISKSGADKTLFGLDKVSPEESSIYIFEGPLDACFVKNGVGLAGINKGEQLMTPAQHDQMQGLLLYKRIWMLDSQWVDETSRIKTKMLIDKGETVFLWPESYGKRYKDFNNICMDKKIDYVSPAFIKKNSFQGKEAVLKFKLMVGRM